MGTHKKHKEKDGRSESHKKKHKKRRHRSESKSDSDQGEKGASRDDKSHSPAVRRHRNGATAVDESTITDHHRSTRDSSSNNRGSNTNKTTTTTTPTPPPSTSITGGSRRGDKRHHDDDNNTTTDPKRYKPTDSSSRQSMEHKSDGRSHDRRSRHDERDYRHRDSERNSAKSSKSEQPPQPEEKRNVESLSISETNRLRANLGLKPLSVDDGKPARKQTEGGVEEDGSEEIKESLLDDVHAPAPDLGAKKTEEKFREKMEVIREKRRINTKLQKVKTLGKQPEDEDDVSSWVSRSRKIEEEHKRADKQAKILEEMDKEFGLEGLVEQAFSEKKKKVYSSRDLKGISVEHSKESFMEGQSVILTLKDKGVLIDEDDTLVNINITDREKTDKNNELKKKKSVYQPYDEETIDEFGNVKVKSVLQHYDDEIHGEDKQTFTLGSYGMVSAEEEQRREKIREQLLASKESLILPVPRIASEYYTEAEMSTKFKKTKCKVKKFRKRRKLRADDLIPLGGATVDHGSRGWTEDKKKNDAIPFLNEERRQDVESDESDNEMINYDDNDELIDDEAGDELEKALERTRRLKQKKSKHGAEMVAQAVSATGSNSENVENKMSSSLVFNTTTEFCRQLGDLPVDDLLKEEQDEDNEMDIDDDHVSDEETEDYYTGTNQQMVDTSAWHSVDILEDQPVQPADMVEVNVLDDEPVLDAGIAAALQLANKKGYLEEQTVKPLARLNQRPHTSHTMYGIEDKSARDIDDKWSKREERGPLVDFKEKDSYTPDFKLEYADDSGRLLSSKEAFRYLSHRFHGKGPGKMKTEKRAKKLQEQEMLKKMNSTDTPLNTVQMLKEKQKQLQTPFVVLSGSGKNITGPSATPITKLK